MSAKIQLRITEGAAKGKTFTFAAHDSKLREIKAADYCLRDVELKDSRQQVLKHQISLASNWSYANGFRHEICWITE